MKCNFCGRAFKNRQAIRAHLRWCYMRPKGSLRKVWHCENCGQEAKSPGGVCCGKGMVQGLAGSEVKKKVGSPVLRRYDLPYIKHVVKAALREEMRGMVQEELLEIEKGKKMYEIMRQCIK